MSIAEQIAKAVGRSKARAKGMVPDQRGRRMRDRIVKGAINPRALAVHSPRMRALGQRRRITTQRGREERRREAERRQWGRKREKPSIFKRAQKWLSSKFCKGKGHRQ